MPALSAIFLVCALVLAVVIGPQSRPWTWGPAMLALGMAVLAALPVIWKRGKAPANLGLIAWGTLTAGWFVWRAWMSPVAELGQADFLLVGGAVAALVSIRAIQGNGAAERILIWGIALLLVANLLVIRQQLVMPGYSPVFPTSGNVYPSGFYKHYNEAANYLIASALLVGAAALFGRHARATRILWGLIAVAGLAGVWFTRSRGGIFGAAVGCGVFAVVALVLGKRRNARWFAPALIAIPVMALAIGAFWLLGWQDAQATRHGGGIDQLLDNDCRLYFLGLALSCIGLHPLAGGGSRSFSWECYRFWQQDAQGAGSARPDMVHNELVQAATDYGLIGAGLLLGLLGALVLAAILRVLFEEPCKEADSRDAWRLGALAGLAGMLVQSCFSFVFHMLAGVVLLGICLGQLSWSASRVPNLSTLATRMVLTIAAICCVLLLVPAGWTGTQVTRLLWPVYYRTPSPPSTEARLEAFSEAIYRWPQSAFYQERAALYQLMAGSREEPGFREAAQNAIDDYQQAFRRHPYDPACAVNCANLLSYLQRDAEAERWYARAIRLQGGMEPGFRGHYSLAMHLWHKSLRLGDASNRQAALDLLELAVAEIEVAVKTTPPWVINVDGRNARISIHENLGAAREAAGDRAGALRAYNVASSIPTGTRVHYRAGVLLGKMAVDEWYQRRPSEALAHFMAARQRLVLAGNQLPQGFTPAQRVEYLAYLDRMIAFLKGAKIQPAKE